MYLCYIDESGTSQIPGNTSHFVLAGLSIPIWYWKKCEEEIQQIKKKYDLIDAEIHTGWIIRLYIEQIKIANFSSLDPFRRKQEVVKYRTGELLRLQKSKNSKHYHQQKKNYEQTKNYIHLTHQERVAFIEEVAQTIGDWGFARLFAECINKLHFDPSIPSKSADEQAFEQLVSRFQQFLKLTTSYQDKNYGILIHDNNTTVAKRHTELMKKFHKTGTLWTAIDNIIETPLFVNSQLTSMIQLADLCAYALRRYLENDEIGLFNHIYKRADRKDGKVVGVRHFTSKPCPCQICADH
jgi:hypothetical protein